MITGRLEFGERRAAGGGDDGFALTPQIIADEVVTLGDARRRFAKIVDFRFQTDDVSLDCIDHLKTTLQRHPGKCRSYVKVVKPGATETVIELPNELAVDPSDSFLKDVEELLGPGRMSLR
jgi:hypothetical protein